MKGEALRLAPFALLLLQVSSVISRTAFEKLTDVDFMGTAYYTVKNLSLYECQGWCREEPDCQAASFRFAVHRGYHTDLQTCCELCMHWWIPKRDKSSRNHQLPSRLIVGCTPA